MIVLLAGLITNMSDLAWARNAFAGIRACVCVQIFNAVVKLAKRSIVDIWTVAIFAVVFLLGVFLDVSPVWFVLLAGVVLVFSNVVKATKGWHPIVFIAISAVAGAVFHFAGV